jgi:hypothetical protein
MAVLAHCVKPVDKVGKRMLLSQAADEKEDVDFIRIDTTAVAALKAGKLAIAIVFEFQENTPTFQLKLKRCNAAILRA